MVFTFPKGPLSWDPGLELSSPTSFKIWVSQKRSLLSEDPIQVGP